MRNFRKPTLYLVRYTLVVPFTLVLWAGLAEAATVTFRPPTIYAVGTGPTAVAVADLNGDGKPDLVSANYGSNSVSVLLGNGDGTFQAARNFNAGNSALTFGVAVGDFNGDGNLDVAVLIPTDGTSPTEVRILMGNGDGTLQSPVVTTLSSQETIVACADVNGDKKADLLVNVTSANVAAGIEILLGNGDGTFQNPKTMVAGPQQTLLAVADFNHDDEGDLVVSLGGAVQIMLNNGDGTFTAASSSGLADGYVVDEARTADLNGDGTPDLIVGSIKYQRCGIFNCNNTRESVFLSGSKGALGAEQVVEGDPLVGVGDFDGDGKMDIAVRVRKLFSPTASLQIYPGNGDGTFAQPVSFPDPGAMCLTADLNGDQLADLIVLDAAANSVSVILNSTPAFHMTASEMSLTLNAGGDVTDNISLTTVNGFSSALQLSCVVSGPAPAPTCALSPPDIPAGANSPTVTMTLSAPAQSNSAPVVAPSSTHAFYAVGLALAFLGFIPSVRLDPRSVRWLVGIVLGALLLAASACGGGSSGRPVPRNQYSVQVTAKSDVLSCTLRVLLIAP
jgi:hypothetical protein